MSMTVTGGLHSNYAAQNVNDKAKKGVENNSKRVETTQNNEIKKPQLSAAAQKLLEKLQKHIATWILWYMGTVGTQKNCFLKVQKRFQFYFPVMNWRKWLLMKNTKRSI